MVYESPLAYVLGIEGLALLRALADGCNRDAVESRVAEIRQLLADDSLTRVSADVGRVDTVTGYRQWSQAYDEPGNPAFDMDEPVITDILDGLSAGDALDAACGTGRISRLLADRGHRVLGVDSSPEMLAGARARVPEGTFQPGDLTALAVPAASTDLVVCALALTHVRDLTPVLAEFTRVLRPGGHVVLSDMHPETVLRGMIPSPGGPDGRPARVISYRHSIGDYVRAAVSAGLRPLRCEEPVLEQRVASAATPPDPAVAVEALRHPSLWPWSPSVLVPQAARASDAGVPAGLIWHFQLFTKRATADNGRGF
jgi:SAM-dependent methyltransferase